MTSDVMTTIAANVVSMAVGACTIYGFLVRPYQAQLMKAQEALSAVTKELQTIQAENLSDRVERLETGHAQCLTRLTSEYVTRREWDMERQEAQKSRGKIFEMLEELLQRTAALAGYRTPKMQGET
jgi:Skp family chaperone for outer membrane proteins